MSGTPGVVRTLSSCSISPAHISLCVVAFVIAWGSMAANSARLVGLLTLNWKLKSYGVKRWESYAVWVGIVVALGIIGHEDAAIHESNDFFLQD